MGLHLAEIAARVTPGRHCALLADQAGWHLSAQLAVPANITIVPLPAKCPELNPGRERLAVHAQQLAVQPRVHLLRRHRQPLLRRMEQTGRPTLARHVSRAARLGDGSGSVSLGITARPPSRESDRETRFIGKCAATTNSGRSMTLWISCFSGEPGCAKSRMSGMSGNRASFASASQTACKCERTSSSLVMSSAGGRTTPATHLIAPFEEILVVRRLSGAIGHDDGSLPGTARTAGALGIIGRASAARFSDRRH